MSNAEVTQKDLHDLLEVFEKKAFEAGLCEEGSTEHFITTKCESLFKLDYTLMELDNANGLLSPRYPGRILIPESQHGHMAATITNANGVAAATNTNGLNDSTPTTDVTSTNGNDNDLVQSFVTFASTLEHELQQHQQQQQQQQPPQPPQQQAPQQNTIYEDFYDINRIRDLVGMAKYARCRKRFTVPVIMYKGKYICRSATISVMPEAYGRHVAAFAYDCLNGTTNSVNPPPPPPPPPARVPMEDDSGDGESLMIPQPNEPSPFSYQDAIRSDILLLNALNVTTILDLMVEMRKIKYFVPVSSSEKADPENHYGNFNIISLPYPGCEFFKKFRDNNYMAKNLYYNWKQPFNDAIISIPNMGSVADLDIAWLDYAKWDLVLITQNYLKATLKYIQEEKTGLLIHCISGWDRTPLFISLVRLSLWADGHIHQSLNALQITYFTLAYDWYLFGHQLPDRVRRCEDIMFFCFHVLKYITDEEFTVTEPSLPSTTRRRTKTSCSSGSSVVVIKSDCDDDAMKEEYNLNFDQDYSNDSISNGSNCDMSVTETTTPMACAMNPTACNSLTSRSPNPKRSRTSPISVPGTARQRHESTSSNGSWQVVTDTGSLDSMANGSFMSRCGAAQPQDNSSVQSGINGIPMMMNGGSSGPSCSSTGSSSSNATANDNVPSTSASARSPFTLRKQRLSSVRAIFIQAYGKIVGLKFKEGSSMNLSTFIGSLADQLF